MRLGTISSRRETKIRIVGRRPPPAVERTLGNCATTTTFLRCCFHHRPSGGVCRSGKRRQHRHSARMLQTVARGTYFGSPGAEPRRGSRCGGAIAARRRVGSRAAPSDPARQRPASVPDAAPTLRGASAIWGKQLVRRFLHSSTSRRRELCWYLVGWREGGEGPMWHRPYV